MINRYVAAAALLVFVVSVSYVVQFYFLLGYEFSKEPEVWGQLGDYFGGLLNPALSFISLVLLIKSLTLQNQANNDLRLEIKETRKSERLRSFEMQLFNMIDSQRSALDSFKVELEVNGSLLVRRGVEAIILVEDEVSSLRQRGVELGDIADFLESVDSVDQIYGMTRIFYNMVKMISEKLSDSAGFDSEDRRSHYLTLINFTDFALLRLIIMSAQFMEYPSTEYLKANSEFSDVLTNVGLGYELY